jgi:hypothetical protein
MKHSASIILMRYMADSGLGIIPGDSGDWPVYIGHTPDGFIVDNNSITLYDTRGVKDGRIMTTGETIIHHGIQLLVKALEFSVGMVKAQEIIDAFDNANNIAVSVDGYSYVIANITQVSDVASLGGVQFGNRNQEMISVNFLATILEG